MSTATADIAVRETSFKPKKIAIMWPRLGPYHIARLETAAKTYGRMGVEVIAIETATKDATYAWDVVDQQSSFTRRTLFPGAEYDRLSRRQLRQAVWTCLDELNPDAVMANGYSIPEAHAAIRWCRRHRRVVVISSDSNYDDAPRVWFREGIKRFIISLSDGAIVGGLRSADYMQRLGMPAPCIFDGADVVDNDYFASEVETCRSNLQRSRQKVFLFVGRFINQKNLLLAMQSFSKYQRQVGQTAWKWLLVGDGPLMPQLLQNVRGKGVQDYIDLPGFVQIGDLPKYYAQADAVWLPSISETWGLVINEAMACGLPVLVSRHAGCSDDFVQNGVNGWTFDPLSVDAMAESLLRMHNLSEEQRHAMGQKSRQIISTWGPQRFADHLWKAIQAGSVRMASRTFVSSLMGRLL